MKKFILPLVIFVVLLGIATTIYFLKRKPSTSSAPTQAQTPINVIDLSLRPYVFISPRDDLKEVSLTLADVKKAATKVDYELEYQAGSLLQGAFGQIDLTTETLPITKKLLLGSCSAGGKCTYHEDVKGGTLTLKFTGEENYALKTEWNFIPTQTAQGKFSSRDGKFQLEANKLLNSSAVVIVMNTSGLPENVSTPVLAGPYGLYSSQPPQKGKVELSLRLSEDAASAVIKGWNGTSWVEFATRVADKTATATVDLLPVYIAITNMTE